MRADAALADGEPLVVRLLAFPLVKRHEDFARLRAFARSHRALIFQHVHDAPGASKSAKLFAERTSNPVSKSASHNRSPTATLTLDWSVCVS